MNTRAVGSYFRNDFNRAVSGLGDDSSLSFADQTLLGIVQAQPSLTYSEWAKQDGDIAWTEVVPTKNYRAFAIIDQQIVATAAAATSVPTELAVVSPALSFASTVSKTFKGTPYAYTRTEAVYAQLDPANPPTIYFLYWLTLRSATDPDIGSTSLNYAALQVAGVLSFIIEVPTTSQDRARPGMSFSQALALRSASPGITIPPTPAQQQTLPPAITPAPTQQLPPSVVPASASAASAGDTPSVRALLIVGVGAAAAFTGYKLWLAHSGKG